MNKHTCLWEDCDSTEVIARGLCRRDFMRARRVGRIDEFSAPPRSCFYCETEFRTEKNGKTKFCSFQCQRLYVAAERISARLKELGHRRCRECGNALALSTRTDSQHCSTVCQQLTWYRANEDSVKARAATWKLSNRDMAKDSDHRRRAAMRGNAVGPIDYAEVWRRDGGHCWICEKPVDPELEYPHRMYRSWDHVIPIIKGGAHEMNNIALSHLVCNTSKKSKILDRLPAWAS